MAQDGQQDEGPLGSEALKRDEWRGGETILQEGEASGHTLPESERPGTSEGDGPQGAAAAAGTVPPPD
jgi:hypothetical protein